MKKDTLIILAVVAAALLWYFLVYKKQTPAAASGAALTPGTTVAEPVPIAAMPGTATPESPLTATGASQVLTSPAIISAPVTASPASPDATTATAPAATPAPSATYDSIILPWMNSLGVGNKAQALRIYPTMTDVGNPGIGPGNEKAALADIIANVWTGKRAQTAADTNFWNAWRVKYHVLDGTYNP
jgi:hypothetical protein